MKKLKRSELVAVGWEKDGGERDRCNWPYEEADSPAGIDLMLSYYIHTRELTAYDVDSGEEAVLCRTADLARIQRIVEALTPPNQGV